MTGKRIKILMVLVAVMLLLSGCAQSDTTEKNSVADRTYTYEGDGFGGSFSITIHGDGSFQYYEGPLSSYIGVGKWNMKDGILILSDNAQTGYARENRFRVDGNNLVFLSENSDNFLYVKIADGEKFSGQPVGQVPD